MPRELADPAVSAAVLDASSLEDLDPSEWVERSVGTDTIPSAPASPAVPTEPPASGLPPASWYTPDLGDEGVSFAPSGDADAGAIAEGWVNPFDVMDPAIANADFTRSDFTADSRQPSVPSGFDERPATTDPSPQTAAGQTAAGPTTAGPWSDLDFDAPASPGYDDPSDSVLDDFFGEIDHEPVTGTVPVTSAVPGGAEPVALQADAADAPWNHRAVQWPAPLSGVTYVGGHPDQTRKRKNGTITFGPAGLRVAGSGLQSWDLDLPWTQVTKLRIEGTDEVMFTEGVRIEPSSSAVIVELIDGAKVYFEVRMRRPGSLRSPLAPMLQLVADIRSYRATGPS